MANNDINSSTPESTPESIEARRKRREEMRRRHRQRQLIFYGAILAVLILIIVLVVKGCSGSTPAVETSTPPTASGELIQLPTPDPNDQDVYSTNSDDTPETPSDVTRITLTAVGDIMVYQEQLDAALQSDGTYDFSSCFTDVAKYIGAGNLSLGNLETTLSGTTVAYQGYPSFNTPEELAQNLYSAGFKIMQTANTYSLQNGIDGLISTIQLVRKSGMSNVGTYYTADDRAKDGGALICEVNGIKIAILSYTKGANAFQVPTNYEFAVNFLYKDYATYYSEPDTDKIVADLAAVKELGVDLVVAMLHWGEEWSSTQSSSQTEMEELMLANGVDVIIGSHSHVLQPMQTRSYTMADGTVKNVFVAYSLGNFLSYKPDRAYSSDSVILNLEIVRNDVTGAVTVGDYNYVPVYISGPENGFKIIDINQAIADYNGGNRTAVTDEMYTTLKTALNDIHTLIGSDRDRGVLTDYQPSSSPVNDGDITFETPPVTDTSNPDDGTEDNDIPVQ